MLEYIKKEFDIRVKPDARTWADFDSVADWRMAIWRSALPATTIPHDSLVNMLPDPEESLKDDPLGLHLGAHAGAPIDRLAEDCAWAVISRRARESAKEILAALSPETIAAAEKLLADIARERQRARMARYESLDLDEGAPDEPPMIAFRDHSGGLLLFGCKSNTDSWRP